MNENDIWADDPDYPADDWKAEVSNDDTRLGYWQWVEAQREWKGGEPKCMLQT